MFSASFLPRPPELIIALALLLSSTPCLAQGSGAVFQSPASGAPGCSSQEKGYISSSSDTALQSLMAHDLVRYVRSMRTLEAQISPACRATLARSQPMMTNCDAEEKNELLSRVPGITQAALAANPLGALQLLGELEDSVSAQCWLALNYPQHPAVKNACSRAEKDKIASLATPARRAAVSLLTTFDLMPMMEIVQYTSENLSPDCFAALQQVQPQPGPNKSPRTNLPGGIQDHGGGTYVLPGAGACTPAGCMAF